jgi:ATP-dependent helicase/nuclease subunit A
MADTNSAPQSAPRLNSGQEAAVYCATNAVVAAGAGSGKTSVLASRFAWLLADRGLRVDQILTLTFTKKAAAEMYRRIYDALAEIAASDQGLRGERAREGLRDFVRARIQTLDSYSVSIVKQAAPRYGIPPDFSNDDEWCRSIAEAISLPFLIAHRSHPAVEKLYALKSPPDIAADIFAAALFKHSAIDGSRSFSGDIEKQFAIICAEWRPLRAAITAALGELGALLGAGGGEALLPQAPPLLAAFASEGLAFPTEGEIRAYFDSLLSLEGRDRVAASEVHPVRAAALKCLEFMSALIGVNLSRGKRKDNPAKELIKELRENIFGSFSSLVVFCMQAGFILSLASLLDELQEQYLDRKRSEGVLTFADVAGLAKTILKDHPDIRRSEKVAFEAIMIDEFQDNNELQKELLFLLAENPDRMDPGAPSPQDLCPGKLFFVGDEKQSIYRFRGADVSVFRKLKDDLGTEDLPLRINYRSAPALIGAFNALFGGSEFDPRGEKPLGRYASVFAPARDLPLFEAAYSPLEAGSAGEGKLSLCVFDKGSAPEDAAEDEEALGAVENEARFTAERIQKLLEEKNSEGGHKYKPEDIAILFRSHSPQPLFEKHLRLLRIPYAGEDVNGFFNGGPVNDLMSALRLTAYPLDAAAYAELLRSPFVGLSLPSLAVCLAAFNAAGSPHPPPFSGEALARIPREEQERFLRGSELFGRLRAKASEQSLSALVDELWHAEGYRYETEWNSQTAPYGELYDYLFHLAARADEEGLGLAAFVDSIQKLRDRGGPEELEIPLERPGAVRLMTIHKSKGLEFPVVFVCCCGSRGRQGGSGDSVFDTGAGGVSFNPPMPPECSGLKQVKKNFFYERSLTEERRKRTAELRRLLYVAMTRAEKELYITGSLKLGEEEGEGEGDLALRLKSFVAGKRGAEDAGDRVEGDSIIDNDTFFGLLLPAAADHFPPEGSGGKALFFDLEPIPAYIDDPLYGGEQAGEPYPNNPAGLTAFLKKAAPYYAAIGAENIIATPAIEPRRRSPTSFREAAKEATSALSFTVDHDRSGRSGEAAFSGVDRILKRFAAGEDGPGGIGEGGFTPADFGTLAHACVEALIAGAVPALPAGLGGRLAPAEGEALLAAGSALAEAFLDSPLGRIARSASTGKSEYPFRSLYGDTFITGTIDLLFEDEDAVYVVDFKTDGAENPGEHAAQMAFYYRAVADLFGKPRHKDCRVWLYYLRTGHAVEMTEAAKGYRVEL